MRNRIMDVVNRMRVFATDARQSGDNVTAIAMTNDSKVIEGLLTQYESTLRRVDSLAQENSILEGQLEKAVNAGNNFKDTARLLDDKVKSLQGQLDLADDAEERAVADAVGREKLVIQDLNDRIRDLEDQNAIYANQQSRKAAAASVAVQEASDLKSKATRLTKERDLAWGAVDRLLAVVDGQVSPSTQAGIDKFKKSIS